MSDLGPNLWQSIYGSLSAAILRGDYAPGSRLPPERDLAPALGTNRNTLREAIRRLEEAGLVSVRHGVGVTVNDFRKTATIGILGAYLEHAPDIVEKATIVADLLPSRARILSLMVRFAAERSTDSDHITLADIAGRIRVAVLHRDGPQTGAAFADWLDALVDAAHSTPTRWVANPFLLAEAEVRRNYPLLYEADPTVVEYTEALLGALRARDADRAERVTQAFFARVDARVVELARALVASAG